MDSPKGRGVGQQWRNVRETRFPVSESRGSSGCTLSDGSLPTFQLGSLRQQRGLRLAQRPRMDGPTMCCQCGIDRHADDDHQYRVDDFNWPAALCPVGAAAMQPVGRPQAGPRLSAGDGISSTIPRSAFFCWTNLTGRRHRPMFAMPLGREAGERAARLAHPRAEAGPPAFRRLCLFREGSHRGQLWILSQPDRHEGLTQDWGRCSPRA